MNRFAQSGRWSDRLRVAVGALVAGIFIASAPGPALAAPAVGTVIGNQATGNYTDAGGTPRITTSNVVQTTITQVKSFTLTAPGAITAAGGQTVYYPHTITNTGNGIDTYTFNAPATGGAFTHTGPGPGPVYFADADGNGIPDNNVALTTTGPIAAGGTHRFVLAGGVPGAAAGVGTMTASVSDTSGGPALTNLDTTTVANSAIFASKSLSVTSGASPSAGPVVVTLNFNNTGSAAATNLVLTDTLPAGMTYVAGSGVWNGSILLSDAPAGDPAGIAYEFTAGQVIATIASVPAGSSGTLSFSVQIPAGRPPGLISNFATYQTSTQPSTNTNTASYQVLRTAGVVANGSTTSSANNASEPVAIASAAAGTTIPFTNVIWNLGNSADTFAISLAGQGAWPAGTTFTLLQADGVTALIANTTPSIPVYAAGCAAGFETDAVNLRCGYRVVLRVQLPAGAAGGPYAVTKTATSSFDFTKSDAVIDTLAVVAANTVDLTNDAALPGAPGAGATGTTVITTNAVTASTAVPTITRFRLYVNNTGAIGDSFNLAVAGTPAGWSVAFRADASGAPADCSAVGANLTNTGPVSPGAARLVCAEVTVPAMASGQAAPGNYDLDFTATSALAGSVSEVKRDRVTVNAVNNVTLTPDNTGQTSPGGSVIYTHVLANLGNVAYAIPANPITFAAGFLADSRSAQGWTSTAYLDGNGNGIFDPGVDDVPANQITTARTIALGAGATRSIFVRVVAPGSAVGTDPPNVTTLTATYNTTSTASATDSTTVIGSLLLVKEQVAVSCSAPGPHAGYSTTPIPSGASTAPGQCIAYRITGTNTTATNITNVVISDNIPANTRQEDGCGAPATSAGTVASPGSGNTGTIVATFVPGTLTPGQTMVVTFCVRIDP